MITLSIPSSLIELDRVLEFINLGQGLVEGSIEYWMELLDTVRKIFIDIVINAFSSRDGIVKISINYVKEQQAIEVIFLYVGIPYNPFERQGFNSDYRDGSRLGDGIAISLIKKSMESTSYVYLNNKNITTVKKYLELAF